ncbi:DUF1496 domain-containing protein [Lunatimonas salinarum]|uniref:DUF1496 domain-containing protein n=1 Tax=Lunatimonas salinarum TaxID=1774590 RepID=UPI003CC91AEB
MTASTRSTTAAVRLIQTTEFSLFHWLTAIATNPQTPTNAGSLRLCWYNRKRYTATAVITTGSTQFSGMEMPIVPVDCNQTAIFSVVARIIHPR